MDLVEIISTKTRDEKKRLESALSSLLILKRDLATFDRYDRNRIFNAFRKAFAATVNENFSHTSSSIDEICEILTTKIEEKVAALATYHIPVSVEKVQDFLENQLMDEGFHQVAKAFILYRAKRTEQRSLQTSLVGIQTQTEDGLHITLSEDVISSFLLPLTKDLPLVDVSRLTEETLKSVYHHMPIHELYQAMIMAARSLIETEPQYSYLAARLLLVQLKKESFRHLNLDLHQNHDSAYREAFVKFIDKGIEQGILDHKLKSKFDLERLSKELKLNNDLSFQYLGLQTLYDRYFIHDNKVRYELPQIFFMRVAMGLSLEETNPTEKAIDFYQILSSFSMMCSTPTLFNSGTTRPQLSSCFLSTVGDDLYSIYNAIRDNAMLSKFAGGLGNDWTPVRGMNAHIKGTNGLSQGVIPFLKVVNDTAIAVNQGGKRKGAVCAYLEIWHRDVEEFIELRKNTGDERRRTHDMNTALWVPDLFMQRLRDDANWTLFSPEEAPELHETYGKTFENFYLQYEQKASNGQLRNAKTVSAKSLWRKILAMVFETGHPWITFKDPCNLRSPQQHAGVVHSSNLCTEITLNTSSEEIAVCNLASINLVAHFNQENQIDEEKLKKTVTTAVRMLDNVIDINYYSVESAKNSNFKHRPVGLGLMGFQDALYLLQIPYESTEAINFADRIMETISYFALEASADLAQERGSYASFAGSLWSTGHLPIDSIAFVSEHRRSHECTMDRTSSLNWDRLREKVRLGMRNSNVLAIAPTATISNICGVSQSIEPCYQNLYVKSNLSGEFTVINPYLVEALKAEGLWDTAMIHDLKYYDGQLGQIHRIPESIRNLFKTAFEIDAEFLLEAGSRRQKWIDQSQSLNLYLAKPSGKMIDQIYQSAWVKGLKTTYYLRTLGATDAEKSTIHDKKLNAVSPINEIKSGPKMCSIDNPECEACQ